MQPSAIVHVFPWKRAPICVRSRSLGFKEEGGRWTFIEGILCPDKTSGGLTSEMKRIRMDNGEKSWVGCYEVKAYW